MTHYRLYFMNMHNGHIDRAENLLARDDREAIETARPLLEAAPLELWSEGRKLHRFEPPTMGLPEQYRVPNAGQEHEASGAALNRVLLR